MPSQAITAGAWTDVPSLKVMVTPSFLDKVDELLIELCDTIRNEREEFVKEIGSMHTASSTLPSTMAFDVSYEIAESVSSASRALFGLAGYLLRALRILHAPSIGQPRVIAGPTTRCRWRICYRLVGLAGQGESKLSEHLVP